MEQKQNDKSVFCVWLWEKGRYRSRNEDAVCVKCVKTIKGSLGLYCICDGMGGYGRGMEAARLAICRIEEWFDGQLLPLLAELYRSPFPVTKRRLAGIIKNSGVRMFYKINEELFLMGRRERLIWGCTASVCIVFRGYVYWFHVGDSAIYCISTKWKRLSKSHRDRKGALTRCLGGNRDGRVDFGKTRMGRKLFLVCSDGFLMGMPPRQMCRILTRNNVKKNKRPDAKEYYKRRLEKIAASKGEHCREDNMSAILLWKD